MNISKYASFFHDGSIIDIQHRGDKIKLSMISAEMDEEDVKDDIILSKDDNIQGKLHVEGVKSIIIDEKPFLGVLKKIYDDGEILDFEITKNSLELFINWVNFSPKSKDSDFSSIKIEAEKICWENIPDLENFCLITDLNKAKCQYLDSKGNPASKGSKASCLYSPESDC